MGRDRWQPTVTHFEPVREAVGHPVVRDVILAVAAAGAGLAVMLVSQEATARDPDVVGVGLLLLAGAILLVRRRWPVVVLAMVTLVTTGVLALNFPGGAELPLVMAALYTAMAEGRRPAALTGLGLIVVTSVGYRLLVDRDDPLLVVITVSLLVLVVLLGEATRTRRRLRAEVRERLRVLEAEKEFDTRARLTAERLRVARELHDVLAHTITAIAVQAGAAADGLEEGSEARRALRSMRATTQEAMQQLQATIAVLRSEHDDHSPLAAPDLSDLQELVQKAADAGLDIAVEIEGAARALPAAVELTAYRIVQEALTNVIRHAGADHVRVGLRYGPGVVTVTVADDGTGAKASDLHGGGFGIVGMRERAQAVGGRLTAGPADGGGFQVQAVLSTGKDGA